MKNISDVARYTLGLCAAAAILGGCGGASQSPNPAALTPSGSASTLGRPGSPIVVNSKRADPDIGRTERLKTTTVRMPRRAVKIAHLGALQNRTPPGGHFKIAHLM